MPFGFGEGDCAAGGATHKTVNFGNFRFPLFRESAYPSKSHAARAAIAWRMLSEEP